MKGEEEGEEKDGEMRREKREEKGVRGGEERGGKRKGRGEKKGKNTSGPQPLNSSQGHWKILSSLSLQMCKEVGTFYPGHTVPSSSTGQIPTKTS